MKLEADECISADGVHRVGETTRVGRIELRAHGSDGAEDMEWNLMERKKPILKWNRPWIGMQICRPSELWWWCAFSRFLSARRTTRVL
jgi:hypothetical protein